MNPVSIYDSEGYRVYTTKSELDKALHTLEGILKGINIDGRINNKEIQELMNWCSLYSRYSNKNPFDELIPIVQDALSDCILTEDEIKDIIWLCNNYKSDNIYYDLATSDMQRLQGIMHGILADNDINKDELQGLQEWIDENDHLSGVYPYDEINGIITTVLQDGKIDENEKKLLKVLFSEYVDLRESFNINQTEIDEIKRNMQIGGIISVCPKINIPDKLFCFTGASSRSSRDEIQNTIVSLGGLFNNNIVKDTNYLVVGNKGNPCWVYSCYGRKVEKAVELRKAGHKIVIIHEDDFWDAVADL